MNSLQNISVVSKNLIPVLVFIEMSDMLRALLTFEIEERLGRKLTDWEWQYFLRERNQKSEIDSRQRIVSHWRQSLTDRQTIHNFVRGE